MTDRRTTRLRSDLVDGDIVIREKGWFIPAKSKDVGKNGLVPWGVYVNGEIKKDSGGIPRIWLSMKEFKKRFIK